jgi:hypothetical protein
LKFNLGVLDIIEVIDHMQQATLRYNADPEATVARLAAGIEQPNAQRQHKSAGIAHIMLIERWKIPRYVKNQVGAINSAIPARPLMRPVNAIATFTKRKFDPCIRCSVAR